ncbi:MAG: DUF1445 domain-containing protein [Chloroflexi bacterium]|nr:DUF1445 domain-containing protein [Chloroflexota bacterium]
MKKGAFRVEEIAMMPPAGFRSIVRQGAWSGQTENACRNYAQANLAVVPKEYALDFSTFCQRNPRTFPVMEVTEPGDPFTRKTADNADLRTDLPKYRVFQDGVLIDEPTDIKKYWRDDLVCFLLGCALSMDWYFRSANIKYRMLGAYFNTSVNCIPCGPFRGGVVLGCRLFETALDAVRAIQVSSRYPMAHGAPIHMGSPDGVGIKDLCHPDVTTVPLPIVPPKPNEVALYWDAAATVTNVAKEARLPLMITHCPAHMFITDMVLEELSSS